jgi:hypothetical protein
LKKCSLDCQTGGDNLEGTGLTGDRLIKIILLMTISYSCDIIEGTIVKRKHLQKYVSRTKEPQRNYRRRSTFGSGNDSQQWINYLEEYTEQIVELMKLTRNKRHFYQRGRASRNLAQARFLAIFVTPPGKLGED